MTVEGTVHVNLKALIALQHEARGFEILPRTAVRTVAAGRRSSRLRGRGLDFEEIRAYHPGDDIRAMDWKVTSRTGRPHVRTYAEERERPVLMVVDQRRAMFFGSKLRMKSVVAAELAGLCAWRVVGNGDRIGAILFNDEIIEDIRPTRSRRAVVHLLTRVVALDERLSLGTGAASNPDQLNHALASAARVVTHDHLVVIVSDMSGWNDATARLIKQMARHNDVVIGLIHDPLERDLPPLGGLVISDGQTQIEVDGGSPDIRKAFADRFTTDLDQMRREFLAHDIPVVTLDTLSPITEQVRDAVGRAS